MGKPRQRAVVSSWALQNIESKKSPEGVASGKPVYFGECGRQSKKPIIRASAPPIETDFVVPSNHPNRLPSIGTIHGAATTFS